MHRQCITDQAAATMQASSKGPQLTPAPHVQHRPCHAGFTLMRVGMSLKHWVQCQLYCAGLDGACKWGSLACTTPLSLTSMKCAAATLDGAQLHCVWLNLMRLRLHLLRPMARHAGSSCTGPTCSADCTVLNWPLCFVCCCRWTTHAGQDPSSPEAVECGLHTASAGLTSMRLRSPLSRSMVRRARSSCLSLAADSLAAAR